MRGFLALMSALGLLLIALLGQITMEQVSTDFVFPFPAHAGWAIGAGICGGYLIWYALSFLFSRPTIGLFIVYLLVIVVMQTVFDQAIDFFGIGSALSLLIHVGVTYYEDSVDSLSDSSET